MVGYWPCFEPKDGMIVYVYIYITIHHIQPQLPSLYSCFGKAQDLGEMPYQKVRLQMGSDDACNHVAQSCCSDLFGDTSA